MTKDEAGDMTETIKHIAKDQERIKELEVQLDTTKALLKFRTNNLIEANEKIKQKDAVIAKFLMMAESAEDDVRQHVDSGTIACRLRNTLLGFVSLAKQTIAKAEGQ